MLKFVVVSALFAFTSDGLLLKKSITNRAPLEAKPSSDVLKAPLEAKTSEEVFKAVMNKRVPKLNPAPKFRDVWTAWGIAMETVKQQQALGSEKMETLEGSVVAMALAAITKARPHMAMTKVAVNIGAHDGITHDPVYPLFASGYTGLAFEGGGPKYDAIKNLKPFKGVKVVEEFAYQDSIADKLKEEKIHKQFDFLKIDIDTKDLSVLQGVLDGGFRPKIIMVEINPDIPPPFKFSLKSSNVQRLKNSNYAKDGFYGCSIASVAEVVETRGYTLYAVELRGSEHNVYMIRDEFASNLPDAPRDIETLFWNEYNRFGKYRCKHMPSCPTDTWTAALANGKSRAEVVAQLAKPEMEHIMEISYGKTPYDLGFLKYPAHFSNGTVEPNFFK